MGLYRDQQKLRILYPHTVQHLYSMYLIFFKILCIFLLLIAASGFLSLSPHYMRSPIFAPSGTLTISLVVLSLDVAHKTRPLENSPFTSAGFTLIITMTIRPFKSSSLQKEATPITTVLHFSSPQSISLTNILSPSVLCFLADLIFPTRTFKRHELSGPPALAFVVFFFFP